LIIETIFSASLAERRKFMNLLMIIKIRLIHSLDKWFDRRISKVVKSYEEMLAMPLATAQNMLRESKKIRAICLKRQKAVKDIGSEKYKNIQNIIQQTDSHIEDLEAECNMTLTEVIDRYCKETNDICQRMQQRMDELFGSCSKKEKLLVECNVMVSYKPFN
jgi:hypothetical protein